jgi:anti-sigma regulatory factor (Ser/Thr protein kinase)/ActR/RegA family two-component response regulator
MESSPPNPQSSLQKTALVVGPEADFAATLGTILPDWKIERVRDNVAALNLIESRPFDLIFTGAETSGKADVELLRRIRMVRPHLRLIILTSESTSADVIASIRERAFSYFSQPLSWSAFVDMVRLAAAEPCWDDGIEVLSATPSWIRLAARCDKDTADRLLQFFHEIVDLPDPERQDVAFALREMLLNAIEHGARFDPNQYVEVSYLRARHMVACRIKDPGEGFSLDEIRHAAITNPPDDPIRHVSYRDAIGLRPGGFGVLLSQRLVDELIYSEKGNEVVLVKYLKSIRSRTA